MGAIDISNAQLSNGKMTENSLIVLAKNLTTNDISAYFIGIATLENLSDVRKKYLNTTTEDNYVMNSRGEIISNLPSNEANPEGTLTATFKVDWNSKIEGQAYGNATNLYESMIMGQTFYHGVDKCVVVSVLGSRKTGKKATKCEINKGWKAFLAYEVQNLATGGLDASGNPTFVKNTFIDKVALEGTSVALETLTTMGNGKTSSMLFPVLTADNVPFSQNDDGDSYAVEFKITSDVWDGENSLATGARVEQALTSTGKTYLEVDYMVVSDIDPTDFGVSGDLICIVNPTTLAFSIKESTGSAWNATTGTFKALAKISANKFTNTTLSVATNHRTFLVPATVSTANDGVATNFNDGGTANPVIKAYTLDRTNEEFVALTVESVC